LKSDIVTKLIEKLVGPEFNKKARKKVKELLSQPFEPDLAERLRELLLGLPVKFSDSSLKQFMDQFRSRRNDISHYGGPKRERTYDGFMRELHLLSGALDHLYHAVILQQIGVLDKQLKYVFRDGFQSALIERHLQSAGLQVLKPSAAGAKGIKDGP
jgi:hypothetical protein